MELNGLKVNFLGDSITEGAGASHIEKCYVNVLKNKYGVITRNYGISGTRIAAQNNLLEGERDYFYGGRIDDMDPDADLVVIFGGTNDFGHGNAKIGTMDDRHYDTFYGALHYLFSNIIKKYYNKKILVLTPLHRLHEDNIYGDGRNPKEIRGELKVYVNAIREVAEYYSLPILDLFKESGMQPKIPIIMETYMPDGLHPNDNGHEIVANLIANKIKSL